MKKEIGILVIASAPTFLEEVSCKLRQSGLCFHTRQVDSRETLCHELQHQRTDIILSNHGLPALDGLTALALAKERRPEIPFVFVTTSPGETDARETIAALTSDSVFRSPLSKLATTLRRALREANKRARLRELELRALTSRWLGR